MLLPAVVGMDKICYQVLFPDRGEGDTNFMIINIAINQLPNFFYI